MSNRFQEEDRFNSSQVDLIKILKKQTFQMCEVCDKSGWVKNEEGEPEECTCRKIFVYLKELVYARIPQEYWALQWKDIEINPKSVKILVKRYLDNFDRAKESGKGVCFLGVNGIGKTTLMAEVGKIAVAKNYNVLYLTAQEYINYKMSNNEAMIDRIENHTNVLLIDELDKPYMKKGSDYVPAQIESLLRNLLPKNAVVCFTSNWREEDIKEEYGDSIYSIIKRKIKLLTLKGDDLSDELQDDWEEGLTEDYNLYLNNYMYKLAKGVMRK